MKNLKTNVLKRLRLLAITAIVAVIGLSFAACGGGNGGGNGGNGGGGGGAAPSTSGRLTITGIGNGNLDGDYAYGLGSATSLILRDAEDSDSYGLVFTGGKISGGSVMLNVWKRTETGITGYNGNDQNVVFVVVVLTAEKIELANASVSQSKISGQVTVNFSNGKGSGTLSHR